MNKKIMPFALIGALSLAFCSCSDDNNDDDGGNVTTTKNETFQAIAEQYLSSTVNYTYKNLADNAEQLVTDLKNIQANPSDANVQKACTTFLTARAWWEKSEAFLFGPASDFGIDPHIDSWPLDLDGLLDEMSNSNHIASMQAEDADEWAGSHLGAELLGFHGIEYIIFSDGAPRTIATIPADRLTYAIAVAGDLRNKCYQLEISWAGEDNVSADRAQKMEDLEWNYTVNGSSSSYGENMLNAGNAGSTFRSWVDALQQIIDGCSDIADEVGTSKIGKPHSGEDPNYIESPYSQKSITDFHDNIVSIENVYMGGVEGRRDESKSIHAYIKSVNADLDTRCTQAISYAQTAILGMKAPFVLNYTDASCTTAINACRDLVDVLAEVKSQLAK